MLFKKKREREIAKSSHTTRYN